MISLLLPLAPWSLSTHWTDLTHAGLFRFVEATPKGWTEKSRFKLDPQTKIRNPQGRIWTHPVISNGRLYLRDQDLIYCYDIKG